MSEYIEIDADQWGREVLESDIPVVVDFYSTECPPCDALAPKFEGLGEIYGQDVKFVKIFRQGNRALAESLNVTGSPTVLFFKDAERVGPELTGGIVRRDMIAHVHQALACAQPPSIPRTNQRARAHTCQLH